jgi:molybdopterin-guanine dinucleotide biosynthesis protein A
MLTGVILAGGSNQCVGKGKGKGKQPKNLLLFEGEKLIHRQIRVMSELCQEIILVTDEPKVYLKEIDVSTRIITDYIPGIGPLSGMYASFSLAKSEDLWIVGSDMPFISPIAARWMLKNKRNLGYDAVIPMIDEIPYVLHGVYDRSCVKVIWNLIENQQYRAPDLLSLIQWKGVTKDQFKEQGIDTDFTRTLNLEMPEQYQA